jgi:hypothetical protein
LEPLEAQLLRQTQAIRPTFWHRLRSGVVTSLLPEGPHELVDVGAGAGLLGDHLRTARPDVTYRFLEAIPSLEGALEGRFGGSANVSGRSSFSGARVVTLLDVLEHQGDDRAFLSELVAKMDPGARLILTVPALRSLWSGWDVALGHHRRYDWRSLLGVLRTVPVAPREMSYLFPELVPAGYVRVLSRPAVETALTDDAAFPQLPVALDAALHAIGSLSMRLRGWWPVGTSLLAVAERRS